MRKATKVDDDILTEFLLTIIQAKTIHKNSVARLEHYPATFTLLWMPVTMFCKNYKIDEAEYINDAKGRLGNHSPRLEKIIVEIYGKLSYTIFYERCHYALEYINHNSVNPLENVAMVRTAFENFLRIRKLNLLLD